MKWRHLWKGKRQHGRKESDGLPGPGKLSTATEIYLYILQAASVQKAVVHDGYAISRPSQDFPFT